MYWFDFDYKRLIHFRSFNLWFCLLQNVCSLFGSRGLLWDVIFFLVSKSINVGYILIVSLIMTIFSVFEFIWFVENHFFRCVLTTIVLVKLAGLDSLSTNMGIKTKRNENNWPTIEFLFCLYNVFKYKIEILPFHLNTFDNSSWFFRFAWNRERSNCNVWTTFGRSYIWKIWGKNIYRYIGF